MNGNSDPRTKWIILLTVGFLSFLVSFGVWIWRLIDLSQKESKKSFKNSTWLTFLMPWGFAVPLIYMSTIGAIQAALAGSSWWVFPTIVFVAMDVAFLAAGIVGGSLLGKEEEQAVILKKDEPNFQCGICYIKYKEDLLGAETAREGKICRFCLDKKQRELR
ncbi:MAG: hypothetical protein MRECE_25c017 [Mycoplasmataceae bacterium CE_OT135]|nr:MAG: hypothetical protein MRECE_25c017 [Mycoplasmataceae bacterium CE_OT135]